MEPPIHDDVVGGKPLADALARWPDSFPPVYVAMIRAGEMGGFLDLVLNQIADFRSREGELKGKVKSAMIYPAVLATLAVAVMIFLLTFFIPRFTGIFDGLRASQLPLADGGDHCRQQRGGHPLRPNRGELSRSVHSSR